MCVDGDVQGEEIKMTARYKRMGGAIIKTGNSGQRNRLLQTCHQKVLCNTNNTGLRKPKHPKFFIFNGREGEAGIIWFTLF